MSPHPLHWLDESLAKLSTANLLRERMARGSMQRADLIELEGQQLINFGSNDYLGLAAEGLADAVAKNLARTGWGAGASPIVTGRSVSHADLEAALAKFEGSEDALLFPTGFAANCGTIPAVVGQDDVIFSDSKNHASIIDGCRLSKAKVVIYPHCNFDKLSELLHSSQQYRRCLIVTDTLFSMDGDLAPLPQLAQLASEHNAMLMVDEAHATGVFGDSGRGVCEHFGVEEGVHIRVGTLSKALGSAGGFVAGSKELVRWLANTSRTYVFSTAAPEALAIAGLAALENVRSQPQRREMLLKRAAELRHQLQDHGYNTLNSASQIIPVVIGCPKTTMEIAAQLRENGMLVPGIRPPTVPQGESLLRISLSYSHTPTHIDSLVNLLQTLLPKRTS
ncbi:MAG: 8-amino-7-oxononanoate synthase [Pirellulaceae bacterium]|jgi:8-amino-7-oxononanoate synthase